MTAHPFLWESLPDAIKDEAKRLSVEQERPLQMASHKLEMHLLLAASHATDDPKGAMHAAIKERRDQLERWKKRTLEEQQERSRVITPGASSTA